MNVYLKGQLRPECHGELVVVITKDNNGQNYKAFVGPISSDEFMQLTGQRAKLRPLERVYVGVSHDAGAGIVTAVHGRPPKKVDLDYVDTLIVDGSFLKALTGGK